MLTNIFLKKQLETKPPIDNNIARTQMGAPCFDWKFGPCFGGLGPFQNFVGQLGSRYMYTPRKVLNGSLTLEKGIGPSNIIFGGLTHTFFLIEKKSWYSTTMLDLHLRNSDRKRERKQIYPMS